MNRIISGQILLIICCLFYIAWWYRGFRPGVSVSRTGGINGLLLLLTALTGIAGIVLSIRGISATAEHRVEPIVIVLAGVGAYILLLFVTKGVFHRIVTSELFLIVGWTMLEIIAVDSLSAASILTDTGFLVMCAVIAVAFVTSMVLYVAYYRMEDMKAFYAAMIPLVTEAVTMVILVGVILTGR
ncbi:MAG: hypothetical protein K6G83_04020 [Lachnospiraceae bacterium]|nr:hypothetical protein [Lachnospiraceae bacterium]